MADREQKKRETDRRANRLMFATAFLALALVCIPYLILGLAI